MPPADEMFDLDMEFARREVAIALASLPDAYREALELRYVEQLSFREVADVDGCQRGERTRSSASRSRRAPSAHQRAVRVHRAARARRPQGRARGTRRVVHRRQPVVDVGDRPGDSHHHPSGRRAERSAVDKGGHRRWSGRRRGHDRGRPCRLLGCRSHLRTTSGGRRRGASRGAEVAPLPPPADATVVVDAAGGAAAGVDPAAGAPADPSAPASTAAGETAVDEQQTFSAPSAVVRSGETEAAVQPTDGQPSGVATAPADAGSTAAPAAHEGDAHPRRFRARRDRVRRSDRVQRRRVARGPEHPRRIPERLARRHRRCDSG